MTFHNMSTRDRLTAIEAVIETLRPHLRSNHLDALKAAAADLQAQLPHAPAVAVVEIERRLQAVKRRPAGNDRVRAQIGVAEEIVNRWPVIRQALEFYDSHVGRTQA